MNRRDFIQRVLCSGSLAFFFTRKALRAETFLTVEQAKKVLWGEEAMEPVAIELTQDQMKSIKSASKVRVRFPKLRIWKTDSGGWFILDKIIGKHENIDMAFALTAEGKVKGLEVLTYRETYGHEIRNPRWRAQFHGTDHRERLLLDRQIKNITGATLSCRHVTDGINRWNQTWEQVLRHL